MADQSIEKNSRVRLNFSLSLPNGEIIDSNFQRDPVAFQLGDGSMLPGFEQQLIGLRAGDEIEVSLAAEQAFGAVNPQNRQRLDRARFASLMEDDLVPFEAGSVVSFKDAGGFDLPGVIKEIAADYVIVDFNHPLAGKEIIFKARIADVLSGDVKPVEIKI